MAGGSCSASTTRHADSTYDALGRQLTELLYAGSGTGSLKLGWTRTYTADGLLTSVAFDGSGSGQGSDSLSFTYDGLGRPDQVKRAATVLTDETWSADGTLASRADGTLGSSTFTYDWAHRLLSASSPLYSGSTGFSWRLDGLLAGRTWPGWSNQLTASYDAAKRPVELAVGGTSFTRTYARDGLVTSETATIGSPLVALDTNGDAQSFSYDGPGRLIGSDLPGTADDRAYAYDLNGNRTEATTGAVTTAYAYDRSYVLLSQALGGGTPATFAYDMAGNLVTNVESSAGATTSTYDLGDRLTSITPPGQSATTFTFDALGRHMTRVTPSGTDTYEYLGTDEVVWRITTGAASVTSAIDAGGNRSATSSGSATGYLLPDLHGNFAAALSPSETVLNAIRYDGYGVTIDAFAAGSGAIATPWRFQGRLDVSPDADTPLYDLSARHYSPGLGTFTQFDSMRGQIAEPLSMNRYLYAHASPSTLTDPTGHAVYMKDGVTANRPAYQALKYQTTLAYVRKQTPSATAVLARLGFGAVRKGGAEVYSPIDGSKSARTAGQAALGTGGAAADILGKNVVKQSVEMMAEWSRAADLVRPIPVVGGWYATLIESGGRGISGAGSALGKVVSVGGKAAGLAGAAWSGVDAAEARLVLERQLNSEASVEIQTVRAGMVGAATTAGGWAGGVVGGLGCAATGYGVWATAGCAGAGGIAGGIAGEWLGNVALDAVDATARVLENLPWGTP